MRKVLGSIPSSSTTRGTGEVPVTRPYFCGFLKAGVGVLRSWQLGTTSAAKIFQDQAGIAVSLPRGIINQVLWPSISDLSSQNQQNRLQYENPASSNNPSGTSWRTGSGFSSSTGTIRKSNTCLHCGHGNGQENTRIMSLVHPFWT